jgi:hypothetical protein
MTHVDLDVYGLHVVNFEHIFHCAYKNIVNDLYLYDKYTDHNIRSQDTKKIYYYYLIKEVCDYIKECNTSNRIVIYYSDKDVKCDFKQCSNKRTRKGTNIDRTSDFRLFMTRFFKQIKSVLPIRVYIGSVKFNTFVQYYNTNKGKYLETINSLRQIKAKQTTMENFKKFSIKFGLSYLTKQYVDSVKIKCMIYK